LRLGGVQARSARGIVTINSTCGSVAIRCGTPLVALGEAIYNVDGLSFQGGLDLFWTQARQPDGMLCEAFVRGVAACVQVKGGFFSTAGLAAAVEGASQRLLTGCVNQPLMNPQSPTDPVAEDLRTGDCAYAPVASA
jgi:capsular polysaccharide export protein